METAVIEVMSIGIGYNKLAGKRKEKHGKTNNFGI